MTITYAASSTQYYHYIDASRRDTEGHAMGGEMPWHYVRDGFISGKSNALEKTGGEMQDIHEEIGKYFEFNIVNGILFSSF
jgi:hypothetical protein